MPRRGNQPSATSRPRSTWTRKSHGLDDEGIDDERADAIEDSAPASRIARTTASRRRRAALPRSATPGGSQAGRCAISRSSSVVVHRIGEGIDERAEPPRTARPVRWRREATSWSGRRSRRSRPSARRTRCPAAAQSATSSSRIGREASRDVRLAGAELGEAVTGARAFDRVVEARVVGLERLGDAVRDRLDGGRASHEDRAVWRGRVAGLGRRPGRLALGERLVREVT